MSAAPTTNMIVELPLDKIDESPFNPRRTFHEQGLDELATDIRSIGRILQPLLVRPRIPELFAAQYAAGDDSVVTGWEVVFGHRRRRAAIMAELKTAPCMVRVMTDEEVQRAQISENLQREDIHPIEEAEGFQALMRDHGLTADDIAEQTGKSRSYVYGRLKLLQACPRVREACLAGKIGSEVALLVARVGSLKLQEKALAYIDKDYRAKLDDGGKASFRAVRDLLNEKFTLQLKSAIFDTEDASLVPNAGRCSSCPKRSGNAPEFIDLVKPEPRKVMGFSMGSTLRNDGPNVCTDPECFDAKKTAHLKRAAAAIADSGRVTVVAGGAARAAVSATGEVKGAYIAANKVKGVPKAGSGKAIISQAGGKVVPQLVKIQDPRTGKVHDAYKVAELQAAGVLKPEADTHTNNRRGGQRYYDAERREREIKGKAETARRVAQWNAMRTAARARDRDVFDLTLIVQGVLWLMDEGGWQRRELLTSAWGKPSMEALIDAVPGMSRDDKALLLLDVVTLENVEVDGYDVERGAEAAALNRALAHYGIDAEAAAAQAAPTPSIAGAGAELAAAGAGAGLVGGDEESADDGADENGAGGPESSSTTPANAGGSPATGSTLVVPEAVWPFPTKAAA